MQEENNLLGFLPKVICLKRETKCIKIDTLETFSVDNGWARFIIFLFADPHLLEG